MEESERRDRYKLDKSYYSATRTVEIDPRITKLHEEVKGLVAMDDRVKQVTTLLMDESMELKVVPIVGSGGLGKTTLAMEVYRMIGAGEEFQCRASVSVSRSLDLEKLLKDILSQVDDKECQLEGWNIHRLIRKTAQILTGKRYFYTGPVHTFLRPRGETTKWGPCTQFVLNVLNFIGNSVIIST